MSILWRSVCSEVCSLLLHSCSSPPSQLFHSDLLSRHVNKCHANEKPLPSTGVRRKGSASASRATTSKQVCDQCVQANTSCDGSNPCCQSLSFLVHFLMFIFPIQQNVSNANIVALLSSFTVKQPQWVQVIQPVRALKHLAHQAL